MKTLHTVSLHIDEVLLWYGAGLGCLDPFHSGYSHEREDAGAHLDCATRVFRAAINTHLHTVSCCNCTICTSTNMTTRHYFMVELGEAINFPDSMSVCKHCARGVHPPVSDRRIQ